MTLSSLPTSRGNNGKRKRVGRGPGSGHGSTSCRGDKGAKARSGYSRKLGFEGGQMPLYRRLPKRGFTYIFAAKPAIINLSDIDALEGINEVTPELLIAKRLVKGAENGIKILGQGNITKAVKVSAHYFSKQAEEKIKKAGGEVVVLKR